MISALITIVVLLLGPGLAYGRSPVRLLRAAANSLRASIGAAERGFAWSPAQMGIPVLTRAELLVRFAPATAPDLTLRPQRPSGEAAGRARFKRQGLRSSGEAVSAPIPTSTACLLTDSPVCSRARAIGGAVFHPSLLKAVQPWLRGGYLDGSGAGDPADNKHGTFACVFFTPSSARLNHFHPKLASGPARSYFIPHLRAHPSLALLVPFQVQTRRIRAVYRGGAVARTDSRPRGLAHYDASVDCNLSPHASLGVYYGYADGKSVIRNIYPHDSNGQLGFLELNYRF